MSKIKPCPFCGCLPTLESEIAWRYPSGEVHWVECDSEDCGIWPCTEDYATEEEAITTWNRREGKK